ncbi:MAG: hypothetical protein NTV55_12130 [Planctomycetota bacterium]|nr:hypothetical protein [Planctomycetota bacterium]
MQQIAKNRAGFLLFSGFCLLAASCKGTGGMGLGAAPVPAAKTSDPLLNSGSYNSEPARATANRMANEIKGQTAEATSVTKAPDEGAAKP